MPKHNIDFYGDDLVILVFFLCFGAVMIAALIASN